MRRNLPRSAAGPLGYLPTLITVVVLLVIAGYGFFLHQTGRFGRAERFNLIVEANPVTLVSVDEKEGTATVVTFPDKLFVSEVVPNYGGYPIASVYKVGQLDKRGGQVLEWTVSELLGVPIDGFLAQDRKTGDVKSFFLSLAILWKNQTDLNLLDLAQFAWGLNQVRFDKIDQFDLGKYATPLVLADGTQALGVDKTQLDSVLSGEFLETGVRNEGLRVEVINSTPVAALGARAARVLTSIGMTVVNVGSVNNPLASCQIMAEPKNVNSLTVTRTAQIYGCRVAARQSEGRADVTVTLGEDYAQRFSQ